MGLGTEFERIYSEGDYFDALAALLPPGEFTREQLADAESDLSRELRLLAQNAKAQNDSQASVLCEGFPWSSTLMLARWEDLAGLSAGNLSIEQRQAALRRWRVGQTNNISDFASVVASYGMLLLRIERPYRAFRINLDINQPLYSGADGNVVRFIVDPQAVVVRPSDATPWTLHDDINKPLFGVEYYLYAPSAPAELLNTLQQMLRAQEIAEIIYT